MFRLAAASVALGTLTLMAGELGWLPIPVEFTRTMMVIFCVIGAVLFELALVGTVDVPKNPPPFDLPPSEEDKDPRRSA